jgi:ABC-type iron transport system FetAB ATPase subunit
MPLDESHTLLSHANTDDVNRDEIREILYRYFDQNKTVIWQDALEEHELLKR